MKPEIVHAQVVLVRDGLLDATSLYNQLKFLVDKYASNYAKCEWSDDINQICCIELHNCILKYPLNATFNFYAYAYVTMRRSVTKFLNANARDLPKDYILEAMELTQHSPEVDYFRAEFDREVAKVFNSVGSKNRRALLGKTVERSRFKQRKRMASAINQLRTNAWPLKDYLNG